MTSLRSPTGRSRRRARALAFPRRAWWSGRNERCGARRDPATNPSGAGSNLQFAKSTTDALGMTHVRFNQFYQGIPVFGAQVVVHMNGEGITAVNGDYVPGISLGTIPYVTAPVAAEAALASLRKDAAGDQLTPGPAKDSYLSRGLARRAHRGEPAGLRGGSGRRQDGRTGLDRCANGRCPLAHSASPDGAPSDHLFPPIRPGESGPVCAAHRRRSGASDFRSSTTSTILPARPTTFIPPLSGVIPMMALATT